MSVTETRPIVVAFRLTPHEAAHIDAAGAALQQPRRRADFCRAIALYAAKQKVPPPSKPIRHPARRLPELDTQLLSKLLAEAGKTGSNVNQLARVANSKGVLPTADVLAVISAEVTEIRNALTRVLRGESGDDLDHQG